MQKSGLQLVCWIRAQQLELGSLYGSSSSRRRPPSQVTVMANPDERLGVTELVQRAPREPEEVPCSMAEQQAGGGLEAAGSLDSHSSTLPKQSQGQRNVRKIGKN